MARARLLKTPSWIFLHLRKTENTGALRKTPLFWTSGLSTALAYQQTNFYRYGDQKASLHTSESAFFVVVGTAGMSSTDC